MGKQLSRIRLALPSSLLILDQQLLTYLWLCLHIYPLHLRIHPVVSWSGLPLWTPHGDCHVLARDLAWYIHMFLVGSSAPEALLPPKDGRSPLRCCLPGDGYVEPSQRRRFTHRGHPGEEGDENSIGLYSAILWRFAPIPFGFTNALFAVSVLFSGPQGTDFRR